MVVSIDGKEQTMTSDDSVSIDEMIDMARGAAMDPTLRENREMRRQPFHSKVAIVQYTPDGRKTLPLIADGKDISPGGLCVISRYMLHPNHVGAVLFQRSNGEDVLIGMRVIYSRYAENGVHESGLMFNAIPDGIGIDDFRDQMGRTPNLAVREAA